jgi:hypothetical protein
MIKFFTPNTEVLTHKGWKKIKNIGTLDIMAFYSKDNSKVVFDRPLSLSQQEYNNDVVNICKKGIQVEVPVGSEVPIIRKAKKKLSFYTNTLDQIELNSSNFFITGGLSVSIRQIITDYELFKILEDDYTWLKPSTLSYKMIDSIFNRLDYKETKTKKTSEISQQNKDAFCILCALSGRTCSFSKNKMSYADVNYTSTSGFSKDISSYSGNVYKLTTNYNGVVCKFNDFVVVL